MLALLLEQAEIFQRIAVDQQQVAKAPAFSVPSLPS
jgi:hypothetical protein